MNTIAQSTTALQVIANLTSVLAKSPTGVSFVAINKYTNSSNEVSNNLINVGASYQNAKNSDIEFLENINLLEFQLYLITLLKVVIKHLEF